MFSEIGTIFMLHRVAPYDSGGISYNENMKVSPDELETILLWLRGKGTVCIGLHDLAEIVRGEKRPEKKLAVFTLDDGYKDNLEHSYAIFKKYNVPFCIYVTNSFPNQTTDLWWYGLERLILGNATLRLPDGRKLDNRDTDQKHTNFLTLRKLVLDKYFKDPLRYFQEWGDLNFDLSKERLQMCLTWDEIKKLSGDPLATIGAHTMNHYPLSRLTSTDVEYEIATSKDELSRMLGAGVSDFAFPFGAKREADKREHDIARRVGFDTIANTVHGHVYLRDNLQQLNRIFLYPLAAHSTSIDKIMYWNIKSYISVIRKMF